MKIKPKPQPITELTPVFVDREVQRYSFQKHLTAIKNSGIGDGALLIYSGVGGIGKTLLFNEFQKMAGALNKNFVLHDFKSNTDPVAVLKTLRKKLSDRYRMEFPLFDKGCIYLAQKNGEFVSDEQKKKILLDTAAFRWFKRNLFIALSGAVINDKDDYITFVDKFSDKISETIGESNSEDLKDFLLELVETSTHLKSSVSSVVEYLPKIFSGGVEALVLLKALKPVLHLIENRIQRADENYRANGNEEYGELLRELEECNAEDDPAYVKELLPKLFAQDLSFYLEEFNTDLIIFLDTYEVLTGEEFGKKKNVRLISENRDVPVDWWVGELLAASRVMWVIASRYEISEIGEIAIEDIDAVENYSVDVLEKNWANRYLEVLDIVEDDLRAGIVKLTGGHPLYLTMCAVTYQNIIDAKKVPRMSDFGKNRDKIIERALGSFDDASLFLLQNLCILGRWTDDLVTAAISEFNPNTYKRLTDLFAEAEVIDTDDDEINVYSFNRTVAAFLLPGLKQDALFVPVFAKIREGANDFFKKFFADNRQENYGDDYKAEIYFNMWSDIILRTTDAPEELMTRHRENLSTIEDRFDNTTVAEIAEKFFDKVGNNETVPSAYFQHCLGVTKLFQERVKDALELERAAYHKLKRLPINDETCALKIAVMNCLAAILNRLERRADEINLREKIIAECESYYSDADDERILDAKENLARALECGDRIDEAIEIRRQIVETVDGRDDENFILAAKNLAGTLERRYQFEDAVPVRKKIADVYKRNYDCENAINALWKVSFLWDKISAPNSLEEKLACYEEIFRLHETNEIAIPADLVTFISDTLEQLGRNDEAAQFYKNFVDDLKRRVESVTEPDEKTFKRMVSLADAMKLTVQFDDEKIWRERATDALKFIAEKICREPVENYSDAVSTLKEYSDFLDGKFYYEGQIVLWRKILALTEKYSVVEKNIVDAKINLTNHLRGLIQKESTDEYAAEEFRLFADVEAYYKKIFPKNFDDFSSTFLFNQILFVGIHLDDFPAAIAKRMEILDFVEKHPKATAKHIFDAMKKIAETFMYAEKYSDEAEWYERTLTFCREHFIEDAPEILSTLRDLSTHYTELEAYDKAEHYQKILVDVTEKKHGTDYFETLEEKERLARILHAEGKFDEESALREQIGDTNTLPEDDDFNVDELFEELESLSGEELAKHLKEVESVVREVKTMETSDVK
ncbi:MAG: tetratricopeptide repeat protein [Selenomonadaceae bacterium]|nr:tetratricopeptide repeat protein [Selenomonadaceae bacterium]